MPRYCLTPGCPAIVEKGFCPRHTRKESDRPNPKVRGWYHSNRWRALRAQQLQRCPRCDICGDPATDVDHRTPHRGSARLFFDPSNLQSLCHRDHARKTRAEQLEPRHS